MEQQQSTAIIPEKISHGLLDNIYMEPTGIAEDPAPAAATGVLSMPPNVGCSGWSSSSARGGSDNCLVPSTHKEGAPWEIDFDPAYLLESFPFLP